MPNETSKNGGGKASAFFSAGVVLYALISGGVVLHKTVVDPRTDDAELFANFIGIAPVVNGPITRLHVVDNQFIHEGEPLFPTRSEKRLRTDRIDRAFADPSG
jgi:membrane fusion protein, multidrug efflux system